MNDKKNTLIFIAIFAAAFLIRFWGIWNVSTTDEYNEVMEALRVCSGHFNMERWIKRLYLYILAVQYGIYYCIGWILGIYNGTMDFAAKIVREMEPLFIIARFTSVVAGTLTVGLLYKIGETFFNRQVAVISSLLLAVTVFHIDLSQQAKVDALLGLLVTTTLYFILKLLTSNSRPEWNFAWCGFFMALAMQTKLNSVILIVPFTVVICMQYRDIRSTWRYLLRFALFFVLGFVLANPPVVMAPLRFAENIFNLKRVYSETINAAPNEILGFFAYPLFYYRSMGPLISIITAVSLFHALIQKKPVHIVILSFLVAFYLLMGSTKNLFAPYYLIPVMPVLYLLVGDFLTTIYSWATVRLPVSRIASFSAVGLTSALCLYIPVSNVVYHDLSLYGKNTRYLAKDWIETNIPFGSKILMDSGKSINSSAPPIAENRQSIERTLANARKNISEGKIVHEMVDKNALIYYELLLKTVPDKAYDITSTMFGLKVESLEYYIATGYGYLIISEDMKLARTGEYARTNMPKIAAFYSSLDTDKRIKLIKTISPGPENSGTVFLIYNVSPDGTAQSMTGAGNKGIYE